MDNNSCVEQGKHTESRVEMLQANWPTGDVPQSDAIDWNERIRESIRTRIQSQLFKCATIFLTIAAAPFILAFTGFSPLTWMVVGLWIMVAHARKNKEGSSPLGLKILTIGLYFNFVVCVLGMLVPFVLIVDGCTALGKEYTDLQTVLFYGSFAALVVMFLFTGLQWKIVRAVKIIKEANEGDVNDGMIPLGAIIECYAIGVLGCLSVVGVFIGVSAILFGTVLMHYRKDMLRLDVEMMGHEQAEMERKEIVPTWKMTEKNQ